MNFNLPSLMVLAIACIAIIHSYELVLDAEEQALILELQYSDCNYEIPAPTSADFIIE